MIDDSMWRAEDGVMQADWPGSIQVTPQRELA